MPKSAKESDYDLVSRLITKLEEKVEANGVASLTAEEKVVYSIWGALGIIENGSFQYFFENDMDAEVTAQAYDLLGMPVTAECFRLARSLLPPEYDTAEWKRRLELLQERENSLDVLATKVLKDTKESETKLAAFVLSHPNLSCLVTT